MIMRGFFLGLILLLPLWSHADEFYDPMRPPQYALNKFRLEELKQKRNSAALTPGSVSKAGIKRQSWVLNSILYSGKRKHAIINSKLVRKGDVINGAKLISLKPDRVKLVSKGKAIELVLPGRSKPVKTFKSEKQI